MVMGNVEGVMQSHLRKRNNFPAFLRSEYPLIIGLGTAAMLHGANNPTLARDMMFAVLMIALNGLVGVSLLLGGLRHREQSYNLRGTNAYLNTIMALAVLGLVLPNFTTSLSGPKFSNLQ